MRPLEVRNLKHLKSYLNEGYEFQFITHTNPNLIGVIERATQVKNDGMTFTASHNEDHAEEDLYMPFGRAKDWEFNGSTCTRLDVSFKVIRPTRRQLTEKETKEACDRLLRNLLDIDYVEPVPEYDLEYTSTTFLEHIGGQILRDIFDWYYGFADGRPHDLYALSELTGLGCTSERCRQGLEKCKKQLKRYVQECFAEDLKRLTLEPCPICGGGFELITKKQINPDGKIIIYKFWLHHAGDDCILNENGITTNPFTIPAGDAIEEEGYVGQFGTF